MKYLLLLLLIGCGTDDSSSTNTAAQTGPLSGLYVFETSDIDIECSDASTNTLPSEIEDMTITFTEATRDVTATTEFVTYEGTYSSTAFQVEHHITSVDFFGEETTSTRYLKGSLSGSVLEGDFYMITAWEDDTWCEYSATWTAEYIGE